MFHDTLILNRKLAQRNHGEAALLSYIGAHADALANAAALLGGKRGVRLVASILEAICQPGEITQHLRSLLLDLRSLLFLEYTQDDSWYEAAFMALLEPEDPAVSEICLLADGFDAALRGAGLITKSDTHAA